MKIMGYNSLFYCGYSLYLSDIRNKPAKQEKIEALVDINIDSIESIIKSVDKAFGYVSLQIQDINSGWTIIGQIQEMDSDTIVIKEFGTMSTLDRSMLMLSVDDITCVDAGGIYESNLMKTHKRTTSANII